MNDITLFETMPVVDERSAPGDSLIESITVVFSDITRYPIEIIDPHADLETDLGIDSVKFGEIFAALRERYSLPPQEFMKTLPPERFRTVAAIADLIAEVGAAAPDAAKAAAKALAAPIAHPPAEPSAPKEPRMPAVRAAAVPAVAFPSAAIPPAVVSQATVTDASLLAGVTQTFADMTRYPVEILDPDADFENDLGIDSVKLGEIFAVLRDR